MNYAFLLLVMIVTGMVGFGSITRGAVAIVSGTAGAFSCGASGGALDLEAVHA